MVIAGACAATILGSATLVTIAPHDLRARGLAPARDIVKLLIGRAPGERIAGDLVSTKARAERANPPLPPQQALSEALTSYPFDPAGAGLSPPGGRLHLASMVTATPADFVTELVWGQGLPSTHAGAVPPEAGLFPLPSPVGSFFPPGSGPFVPIGGGGGGGGAPVIPPQPPVMAVPEPDTWAMMIVGMTLCGAALRRRRRRKSRGSHRARA